MEEVEDCRIVLIEGLKFDLTHSGHKPRRTFSHMTVTLWYSGALGGHFGLTLGPSWDNFGTLWGDFGVTLGPLKAYEGDLEPP